MFNISLIEFIIGLWPISIVVTPIIAVVVKNRNVFGWFFLGLILGPFAFLIVLLLPKVKRADKASSLSQVYKTSSINIKEELSNLKTLASDLNNRIRYLEDKIKEISSREEVPEVPKEALAAVQPSSEEVAPHILKEAEKKLIMEERHPDLEQKMGRYWLNRIGILVLATGIAFLISYAFKSFGAFAKIMTGYLVSLGLFTLGIKLERSNKFVYYGRSLLGGGWAIAYFTTYAMYHFEASRIISNQLIDLLLLAMVALLMLAHTLKYKLPELSSIALFVGYFTATLGDINAFTLVNCLILALISVILVYKMRWLKMIFVGISLTYLTHIFWVFKNLHRSTVTVGEWDVQQIHFWLNNGFLVLYWLLFTVSIYLIKNQNENEKRQLAVANFSNFLPFFVLAYARIFFEYPEFKFPFVLGLGIVYVLLAILSFKLRNQNLSTTNTLIALSLLTLSVPLKTVPVNTTFIWLVELPCILYIGLYFQRRSFRIFSLALALVLFVKMLSLNFNSYKIFYVFGQQFTWKQFIFFVGAISAYLCVFLSRRLKNETPFSGENFVVNVYSGLGTIYLTTFLWDIAPHRWLTLSLAFETLALFIIGLMLSDKYFRGYSVMILFIAFCRFLFWDISSKFGLRQWVVFAAELCIYYMIYILYRAQKLKTSLGEFEKIFPSLIVTGANFILAITLWSKVSYHWISLAWSFEALALFIVGLWLNKRLFRWQTVVLFFVTASRILFIDISYDFNLARWLRFIAALGVYYFIYFIYKNLKLKKMIDKIEEILPAALFSVTTLILTVAIFKEIERNFVSLALGIEGAILFAIGFNAKDRYFRIGGFVIFGLTLLRIIVVDLAHIAVIYKIISFIILGAIFLITSFFYNKYNVGKDK